MSPREEKIFDDYKSYPSEKLFNILENDEKYQPLVVNVIRKILQQRGELQLSNPDDLGFMKEPAPAPREEEESPSLFKIISILLSILSFILSLMQLSR